MENGRHPKYRMGSLSPVEKNSLRVNHKKNEHVIACSFFILLIQMEAVPIEPASNVVLQMGFRLL